MKAPKEYRQVFNNLRSWASKLGKKNGVISNLDDPWLEAKWFTSKKRYVRSKEKNNV